MKKLIIMLLLLGCVSLTYAQTTMKSTFGLASDTVTNTNVEYLQALNVKGFGIVTVQINVTKISGTVGGTMTLLGSIDGTNYVALNVIDTQTPLATIAPADADGVYQWTMSANPYSNYRVSWAGAATMAASMNAKISINRN